MEPNSVLILFFFIELNGIIKERIGARWLHWMPHNRKRVSLSAKQSPFDPLNLHICTYTSTLFGLFQASIVCTVRYLFTFQTEKAFFHCYVGIEPRVALV